MKRSLMLAMAVLMLWPMLAWAKPKEQTFAGTQQQVFEAAYKVARENYIITYADEKRFTVAFNQGAGLLHGEIMFNAAVGPEKDGKVIVSLNIQGKRGKPIGGGLADKYFELLAKELKTTNAEADKKP